MMLRKIAYTLLLTVSLATNCKPQSIRYLTTTTDSLRKLLPKGYYIFTEVGAKEALKAKIDAAILKLQLDTKDSILAQKETIIIAQKHEIQERILLDANQAKALRKAKTLHLLVGIEVWTYRVAIVLKLMGVW